MSHISHQISDYVLGLLPPSEKQKLEQHAAECGECRHSLQAERQFTNTLHQTLATAATPHPTRLAKLRPATTTQPRWHWQIASVQAPLALIACFMLFIMMGSLMDNFRGNGNNPILLPAPSASSVVLTATAEPATSTATATSIAREMPAIFDKTTLTSTPNAYPTPIAALFNN
jgi:anti-sigma factor RsiW